ncbi:MAG: hypothetical protein WCT27_01885 [Patescibacteria group bacterium]
MSNDKASPLEKLAMTLGFIVAIVLVLKMLFVPDKKPTEPKRKFA